MQVIGHMTDTPDVQVRRPRYTDEFRARCTVMLEAEGYPETEGALTRIGARTGVPLRTLSRWYNAESNPPPDRIVNAVKRDMIMILEDVAYQHGENAADVDLVYDTSARDSAVVMGIAIDKLRLLQELSGEATSALREFQAAASLAGVDGLDMLRRLTARLNQQAEAAVTTLTLGE